MLEAVLDMALRPVGAVGACVSPVHGADDPVTEAMAEWFPAASYASTANVCVEPHARFGTTKLADAGWPLSDPSVYTSYPATPTLSVAELHDNVSSEMLVQSPRLVELVPWAKSCPDGPMRRCTHRR
jgi:hypothetical protein